MHWTSTFARKSRHRGTSPRPNSHPLRVPLTTAHHCPPTAHCQRPLPPAPPAATPNACSSTISSSPYTTTQPTHHSSLLVADFTSSSTLRIDTSPVSRIPRSIASIRIAHRRTAPNKVPRRPRGHHQTHLRRRPNHHSRPRGPSIRRRCCRRISIPSLGSSLVSGRLQPTSAPSTRSSSPAPGWRLSSP